MFVVPLFLSCAYDKSYHNSAPLKTAVKWQIQKHISMTPRATDNMTSVDVYVWFDGFFFLLLYPLYRIWCCFSIALLQLKKKMINSHEEESPTIFLTCCLLIKMFYRDACWKDIISWPVIHKFLLHKFSSKKFFTLEKNLSKFIQIALHVLVSFIFHSRWEQQSTKTYYFSKCKEFLLAFTFSRNLCTSFCLLLALLFKVLSKIDNSKWSFRNNKRISQVQPIEQMNMQFGDH